MNRICPCKSAASREDAMVVIKRDNTGKPTVWCDPCIAPLIAALNTGGVRTLASCCGHGHRPGFVMLEDGRDLVITPDHETAVRIGDLFDVDVNGDGR